MPDEANGAASGRLTRLKSDSGLEAHALHLRAMRQPRRFRMPAYTRPFSALGLADAPLVGGKTASLGELTQMLAGKNEITAVSPLRLRLIARR